MPFNFKSAIGSILVNLALPALKSYGATALKTWLQTFHDENPKVYAEILNGLYPVIDVQLEDYVKGTDTTIDDDLVATLKKVIEESAAANGLVLVNLDND